MNATIDDAAIAPIARARVTPGATPQTPLRLLQTPLRPVSLRRDAARPQRHWLSRLSSWLRHGR